MRFRRILFWLLLCCVVFVAASAATLVWARNWLNEPVIEQAIVFEVPRGASVMRIGQILQQQIDLKHPQLWSLWARYQQVGSKIKAGEYQLQANMTPSQLLELFTSGDVLLRSITIVEGTTFAELRKALAARDDVEHALATISDEALMRMLMEQGKSPAVSSAMLPVMSPAKSPEAQFFPDTYRFARGTRDIDILRMAHERMQKELDNAWRQRDPNLSLESPYEALILASIVEKESALAAERPMIAGLFLERLSRNMRLQTDPTVIYGLGERFDGNLRKDDLLRDTPYNTYTRYGLPPTPICLPGAGALLAAVRPQMTGAIYFVATGNGDGSHHFSRTLEEHNAAVRRYLQTLRRQHG